MNLLIVDSQGILSKSQLREATDRLFYSLARFAHRLKGASMQLSTNEVGKKVNCQIDANVEGAGVLSVRRSSLSSVEAMNLAFDAVESKVALRVDWRSWLNAETFATWINSLGQPWHWLTGAEQQGAIHQNQSSTFRPQGKFREKRRKRRKSNNGFIANSQQTEPFSM